MHVFEVLRRPVVTEKSTMLQGQHKYVFEVATAANKNQIKAAVEAAFNVKVTGVNVSKVHGKVRRMGKTMGKTPDWKKAVVTVEEGQKIEFFEGV